MNGVSWIIYFADILSKFSVLFGLALAFVVLGVIIYSIGYMAAFPSEDSHNKEHPMGKYSFTPLIVAGVLTLLVILIPSQKAMLAIAGSEVIEEVATSKAGSELSGAVLEYFKSEAEDNKSDKK